MTNVPEVVPAGSRFMLRTVALATTMPPDLNLNYPSGVVDVMASTCKVRRLPMSAISCWLRKNITVKN